MNEFGTPCLNSSIKRKRFRQAKLLIELSCININDKDNDGRTALIETCFLEDEEKAVKIAKLLLQEGAKIGLRDKKGRNSLIWACKLTREKLANLLIDEALNFDLNASDCHGNTALHYAALSGNHTTLIRLVNALKRFKMSVDKTNNRGETPLICASKKGHVLCAQYLVDRAKASTEGRDSVEFKTAAEWKNQAANELLSSTQSYSLDYPGSSKRVSTNVRYICRPRTALEKFQEKDCTIIKSYRNDFQCLFKIYEKQVSIGFRPSVVKQKPMTTEETGYQESLILTSSTSPTKISSCQKLLTARKTAKITIDSKDLYKRRSSVVPELDDKNGIDSPKSTINPLSSFSRAHTFASRLPERKSAKDGNDFQSLKAIGRISLRLKTGPKNSSIAKSFCREEKGLQWDKNEHKKKAKNGQNSTDEGFLNNSDDDDGDDEDDLMTLSSPAILTSK